MPKYRYDRNKMFSPEPPSSPPDVLAPPIPPVQYFMDSDIRIIMQELIILKARVEKLEKQITELKENA